MRDKIIEQVINKIKSRSDVGYKKYGVTLQDDEQSLEVWLTHIQEELMDAVNYIEKVKDVLYMSRTVSDHQEDADFTKEEIDCDPKNIVKLMAQANIDSLIARYGDDPKDYSNYVDECLNSFSTLGRADLGSDDIYNMLMCWEYQSCEVDNWHETDAFWLHIYLKDWVAKKMATNASVNWSYNKSRVA